MKKLISLVVALGIVVGAAGSARAADAWFIDVDSIPLGMTQVAITESGSFESSSTRFSMPVNEGSTEFAYLCPEGIGKDMCDVTTGARSFNFSSVLPTCASATQEDCIENLKIGSTTTELQDAKFVRQIKGTTFDYVDKAAGLYAGSTVSLWQSTSADSGAPKDYAVIVRTNGHFDVPRNRYLTTSINASVVPYSIISGSKYRAGDLKMGKNPVTGKEMLEGWGFSSDCVWTEDGICGRALDFAPDGKVQLSIRVSNEITGWLKGRINAPTANIEKFSDRNIRLTIAAQPALVPRFSVFVDEKTLPLEAENLILAGARSGNNDRMLRNTQPDLRGPDGTFKAFAWLDSFRAIAKDTAAAESTIWSFSTIDPGSGSACLAKADGVAGVVTTNATVFSGVAPNFENGMLTYSVAGMHYAPDGKNLNLGTYDLVMRSDVARCLYGFTNAPVSASISVIADNGETKTATTVVNEKDGWLYLRAAGFTFSSPKIQVKLTQEKPVATGGPSAKGSITCVKGKLTKKVTGSAPKCPAGYKKK